MQRNVWGMIFVITLLLATTVSVEASRDRWVKLGENTVRLVGERDEIKVGASEGRYKKLKLVVRESDVEFRDVTVVFANGNDFEVPLRDVIRAGGESRQIDLPGDARAIRKIKFKYKTASGTLKRAKVSVWGLKD